MTIFWRGQRAIGHVLTHQGQVTRAAVGHIDAAFLPRVDEEARRARVPGLTASVVICTRDRHDELARCLASLPEQSLRPREVIVVDNASRDGRTREVALAAGVTYVREDRPGLDFARNTGARTASSEIVAYTDDDVLLHPRWLERLVAAFDEPSIAAVTGLVLPAELATEAQRHFETYWGFGQGYLRRDFEPARFINRGSAVFPAWDIGAGASMAFRRAVFDEVGLFDERLDVGQAGCSGDSEYWYRLLAHGHRCRYAPDSIAFHFHRRTIEGLAGQIYAYMRGHTAALMVQYERTGIVANRARALRWMPAWYARRLALRLVGRRRIEDRFLGREVAGYVAGLRFYQRHRRSVRRASRSFGEGMR
ncbi:glycosyltransferase family 2 protein [Sphingomonas oligoaromativorans]|uniref:glycosyltransferase family 2 protein n=1 Tax=Sphingomonas oligoaromativorans TaxID=575322 RepID=UPI00141FD714|nr:glycosyltransferase [Sphingomonas oligoaromativorans]